MGYDVRYEGEFRFAKDLTIPQLAHLSAMLGEDSRAHPSWGCPDIVFVALGMAKDFGGLEWDGSEKCAQMEESVNVVLREMRKKWPDFAVEGSMDALGEDGDRWEVRIGASGLAEAA